MVHATPKSHAGVRLRNLGIFIDFHLFLYTFDNAAQLSARLAVTELLVFCDGFDETYYQAYGVRCLPEWFIFFHLSEILYAKKYKGE